MYGHAYTPPWLAVLLLGLVLVYIGALARASDTDDEGGEQE